MANYTVFEVVQALERNQDIKIKGTIIEILKNPKGVIGNKTKGKIDFLTRYQNFVIKYVESFK